MSNFSRPKAISLGAVGAAGVAAAVAGKKTQQLDSTRSGFPTVAQAQAQSESEPRPRPRQSLQWGEPPQRADSQPEVNSDGRFAGKVVLITGATSGIGEATARAFAFQGATVHFCGRRQELGQQVAQSIVDAGGKATYQPADVRNEDEVIAFVDGCIDRYGKIDVAFNNAGIVNPQAVPLAEQSLEDFENVLKTNAIGYFLSMKYEIPHLLNNEPWGKYGAKGVIVNNASVSGHIGFPGISPYSSSKHAIIGMTKCAALDYGGQGIRINSISPGAVNTPMRRQAYENQGLSPNEPLPAPPNIQNRANTPEEMADIVMLLASTDVSYLLGTDIDVTTGMLTGLLTG